MPATLPSRRTMVAAFRRRDAAYDGVFVTAVRTTRIFCRPTCPARKPKPENVEFFKSCADALAAGYRPCRRCTPLANRGDAPEWLAPLLTACDRDPARRWRDRDLRALGVEPRRVSRWFKTHHGITFHAYSRARRLGVAMTDLNGAHSVSRSAVDAGYASLSAFNRAFQQYAGGSPTARRGAVTVHITRIPTPLGAMIAAATADALVLLEFSDRRMLPTQFKRMRAALDCVFTPGANAMLARVRTQLDEYFAGKRASFDVPLAPSGTEFQQCVWAELRRISCGTTASYGGVARAISRPTAVRAVARANGDNPIAIIVPCHRVVGSDGKLVGYGGGLWRKKRLLELEARVIDTHTPPS